MAHQFQPGAYKVLYVYELPGVGSHEGLLKIGDATLHYDGDIDSLIQTCAPLNPKSGIFTSQAIQDAANERIKQQVNTSGVKYNLVFSALAVGHPMIGNKLDKTKWVSLRDHDLHNLIIRYGVQRKIFNDSNAREWFKTDIATVILFFNCLQNHTIPSNSTVSDVKIQLRPEQKEAVKFSKDRLKGGSFEKGEQKEILWSAVMRFGKTLTSYQMVKEHKEIDKVLIITHRPVVGSGWEEDFYKIFKTEDGYHFGSKKAGLKWDQTEDKDKFFYFSSIQDLRGSFEEKSTKEEQKLESALTNTLDGEQTNKNVREKVIEEAVEEFSKNSGIFNTKWDLIIVDESHEGTTTELAERMRDSIASKYWLHLSGTPFNISSKFSPADVYTWDYTRERKAAEKFAQENPNEISPYASLPTIETYVYNISDKFKGFSDGGTTYFDFSQFFKTKTYKDELGLEKVKFVDEKPVRRLLNLVTKTEGEEDSRKFPFDSFAMKKIFSHTFWLVPNVNVAIALQEMLNKHSYFGEQNI